MFGTGVGAIYAVAFNSSAYVIYSLVSSIGALLGDIVGAFIKEDWVFREVLLHLS
jgi:hypothetical protein